MLWRDCFQSCTALSLNHHHDATWLLRDKLTDCATANVGLTVLKSVRKRGDKLNIGQSGRDVKSGVGVIDGKLV